MSHYYRPTVSDLVTLSKTVYISVHCKQYLILIKQNHLNEEIFAFIL